VRLAVEITAKRSHFNMVVITNRFTRKDKACDSTDQKCQAQCWPQVTMSVGVAVFVIHDFSIPIRLTSDVNSVFDLPNCKPFAIIMQMSCNKIYSE
jgi:hypothetical protein